MHWLLVPFDGQSQTQGNDNISNAPVGVFTGTKLNGVKMWTPTGIKDFDVTDLGASGNGHTYVGVGSSSTAKYSFLHLVLHALAQLGYNVLTCGVSEGGSKLGLSSHPNGSWNATYGSIPMDTPKLLEILETKWAACVANLALIGDTYETKYAFSHQGEADANDCELYGTWYAAKVAKIRTFTGNPNLYYLYGSVPFEGVHNNWIEKKHFEFAQNVSNKAFCADLHSLKTFDGAHLDSPSIKIFKEIIMRKINELEGLTTIPKGFRRKMPKLFMVGRKTINFADEFLKVTGITDSTEVAAIHYLHDAKRTNNLWDTDEAIYPMVGGTNARHAVNLKNPHYGTLAIAGAPVSSATGLKLNGVNSYLDTPFRVGQDFTNLNTSDFGIDIYSRTNSLTGEKCVASWSSILFRMYVTFNGYMRMDIGDGGFDLKSDLLIDSFGLYSAQVRSGEAQILKNDRLLDVKAYTANGFVNSRLAFGYETAGIRFSDAELAYAAMRRSYTLAQQEKNYEIIQIFQNMLSRKVETILPMATYTQLIDYAVAQGIAQPGSACLTALQTLYNNAGHILRKFNLFYLENDGSTANPNFAAINLINPGVHNATFPNGIGFDGAFIGNPSLSYHVETNFNPATQGAGKYVKNNACRFMKMSGLVTNEYIDGVTTSNRNDLRVGTHNLQKINQGGGALNISVNMGGDGFKLVSTNSPTTADFQNGATRTNATKSGSSVESSTQKVLRRGTNYANGKVHAYGMGAYIKETEYTDLCGFLTTYRAAF